MPCADKKVKKNLEFFKELLNSTGNFFFWTYNNKFKMLDTNSPTKSLDELFHVSGCKDYLLEYVQNSSLPIILWSNIGLLWFAASEREGEVPIRIHVVGPINSVETALSNRVEALTHLNITIEWKIGLERLAKKLPMMSTISLVPYTQMLYRCVTGKTIARNDIQFQKQVYHVATLEHKTEYVMENRPKTDRHIAWMLEQAVLSNVRDGNLNYQEDWDRMCSQATGVRVEDQDMLTRGKMSVITFIGSCVRAAIEGGMLPEEAHARGDEYLHSIMECTAVGDVRELNHAMYADFVQRVHKCRTNSSYSKQIQNCCDYIEANIDENIATAQLAHRVGYSEYYLTRKFKEETGVSIVTYTKCAKIERAKQLLTFTILSIQEISDKLHFCSRSYFTEVFRTIAGVTPAQYRKENQKL